MPEMSAFEILKNVEDLRLFLTSSHSFLMGNVWQFDSQKN